MKKMVTMMVMAAVVCLGVSQVWAYDITTEVKAVVVFDGETVNLLTGGCVEAGGYFQIRGGGVLNVDVGKDKYASYTAGLDVYQFGQVNLYSGIIQGSSRILGELNIYGGVLENVNCYGTTGVINVYGSDFALDGQDISGTFELNFNDQTGYLLTGTLSTGESLNLFINPDYSGDSITINLVPAATSPEVMLSDLGQFIEDEVALGNIEPELAVSLMAKVNAASSALARGNPNDAKAAMNDLKALINQVEAQMDKKIDPITAQAIIDNANQILAALGG